MDTSSNIKLIADCTTFFQPDGLYLASFPTWRHLGHRDYPVHQLYAFGKDLQVSGSFLTIKQGFRKVVLTNEYHRSFQDRFHEDPYVQKYYREDVVGLAWGNSNIEIRLVIGPPGEIKESEWYNTTKEQAVEALKQVMDEYREIRRKEMESVPGREETLQNIIEELDALGTKPNSEAPNTDSESFAAKLKEHLKNWKPKKKEKHSGPFSNPFRWNWGDGPDSERRYK